MDIKSLEKLAKNFRRDIIQLVYDAKSGHPGGSLSEIDILTALYFKILNINAKKPKDIDRDRFILSKGHCSPGMYAVLAGKGFFPKEELKHFRKINSLLQGHTDIKVPGIEMSSGSLGYGLSFANGIALASRLDKRNYHVFTMLGDGETEEGQIWESAMFSSFHKLTNVTVIIDRNRIQNDGFTKDTMLIEPLRERWQSFGWEVIEIDGHNMKEIVDALKKAKSPRKKPLAIIAHTVKGKGISFMENNPSFHGKAPNDEEYKKAMEELK